MVVQHPVLEDRLAVLRDAATPHGAFRLALHEASGILAIEATRDLPTVERSIESPLESVEVRRLEAPIIIVPVLRAGLGMVEGFLRLLAFERLPPGMGEAHVFLLDPMLATGGSAVAALDRLKANGARRLRLICLVAAPEGVEAVRDAHPDVTIWTAALDRQLDEHGYIRPGLGDAGDRVFGTTG